MKLLRAVLAGLLLFLWAGTQPVQALPPQKLNAGAVDGVSSVAVCRLTVTVHDV